MRIEALLLFVAFTLTGCGTTKILFEDMERKAAERFSPRDIIVVSNQEKQEQKSDQKESALGPINDADLTKAISVATPNTSNTSKTLEDALQGFSKACAQDRRNPVECKLQRNNIQDRLIASSNALCRNFKNSLKQAHAQTNIAYGNAATLFGGIGAMVTSVTPARILSGAASIATGVRAEYNQNMYSMLAIEIVTKAIDKTRNDALKEIDKKQFFEIEAYSLQRAIADAEEYHSRCSLLAGLQEASTAVSQANNTGLKELKESLAELGHDLHMQVGKETGDSKIGEHIFLADVCKSLDFKYKSFIEINMIDMNKKDISQINSRWKTAYERECANGGAPVDGEWTKVYVQLGKTTLDVATQRHLKVQLTTKQDEIRQIRTYLNEMLDESLAYMKSHSNDLP